MHLLVPPFDVVLEEVEVRLHTSSFSAFLLRDVLFLSNIIEVPSCGSISGLAFSLNRSILREVFAVFSLNRSILREVFEHLGTKNLGLLNDLVAIGEPKAECG